ncbi:serpin family protein [Thermophagus xiamenensis]|uniref:Serpin B n=1 Tax=Thermophagus xiamenensis TaxID=385682 RepID=A0A1I1VB82_9BACT|nr:serpin family protein [Thermophagus xiamenensis]SFD77700.1 serpin B [Thermophagus xiamenensis]
MERLLFVLNLILILSGCCWFNNDEGPEQKVFDLKSLEVLSATDRFGWELLKAVNEETKPGENVIISSLSVAQALGMTTNGAAGETLEQMLEVLDFGEVATMNEAFRNVRDVLSMTDPKVEIEVANSVWYLESLPAKQSFKDTVEAYYDAVFKGVDFSDSDKAKEMINGWVDEKTRGKIPTIIDQISDQQYMFLVNAVYFLGKWKYQFDETATINDNFYLSDGSAIEVPMMNMKQTFPYYSDNALRAVRLPYGNGSFNMILIQPLEDVDVDQLIENMDVGKWEAIVNNMHEQNIALFLPRFEVACKYELNAALKNMGMELPFSALQANFSNMIDAQVYISEVNHKTYLKVDEEGTEAAAVTSVGMELTSVSPESTVTMKFDRPFFFAITEKNSGAVLFSGKIENPLE